MVKRDAKTGKFLKTPLDLSELRDRLLAKVTKKDCWHWNGALNKGYGKISVNNKAKEAHRIAYELFVGQIPEGMVIDHLCRNTRCVNPEHLEPVSHSENVRRGNSGKYWAEKTHCPQEHEYTESNTYIDRKGSRNCRECKNMRRRKDYLKLSEAL